tara:strand:- start:266 stop:568 length:303 start_codon:yes stop_codon:yes gene_type:complete
MKLNKNTLVKAWGMSNKNAAIFARHEKIDGSEWMFSEDRKVSDCATREAAKSFLDIGLAEFIKLTNKKAKEETLRREENESALPAYCHVLGNTEGLANWK